MEVTLTTELQDKAKEIVALREKQVERFEAIKTAQGDERSALKMQCEAAIKEIEAKSNEYEDGVALLQQEQANREAIKSMGQVVNRRPFSGAGSYGEEATAIGGAGNGARDTRTLGERITESDGYKHGIASHSYKSAPVNIDIDGMTVEEAQAAMEIKATMTTAATWAPYGPRMPGYVPSAVRTPTLRDLIPQDTTTSPIFYYMEETTGPTGEQATYVPEGGTKPEMNLAVTSRTAEVAKIAATMQISEELLEDIPQFRSYVDNRGTLELDLAEENALLNFTVGANKFDGFLQKSGVQTQARGTDPTPTAILKGMVKVQWSPGFAGMATGLAMNPVDWQNVLTLQESTGAYIWSAPSAPTAMPDMRMWGMNVRPVVALPQGTSLLGNFRMFSMLWVRSGLSIRVAWANDDSIKNLVRLIFEKRETLVISRGAAFCKVTGLPA